MLTKNAVPASLYPLVHLYARNATHLRISSGTSMGGLPSPKWYFGVPPILRSHWSVNPLISALMSQVYNYQTKPRRVVTGIECKRPWVNTLDNHVLPKTWVGVAPSEANKP